MSIAVTCHPRLLVSGKVKCSSAAQSSLVGIEPVGGNMNVGCRGRLLSLQHGELARVGFTNRLVL